MKSWGLDAIKATPDCEWGWGVGLCVGGGLYLQTPRRIICLYRKGR